MPFFVDDSTDNDLLYPKEFGRGYDESQVEPVEMPKLTFGDAPGQMKIIPKSDWSEIIREKNEKKSGLAHMREYYGPGGGRVPTLDQNGQGYCWAYSVSRMMMYWRMLMNLPTVRLSGHAIGCMVKNFRDEGGWCGLSYKFAMERGIPSVDFWKEKSMDRSNDNQATWDNAAGHKIVNGWYQLDLAVYDQNMLELQIGTCLLRDVAVAADFPWWSHSVCLKALQEPERGSFAWDLDNSWTDGWGENGAGLIRGNKMKTAGAVALIASTTALN